MSGLAAVLAGKVPAGTYRWRAAHDAAHVQHAVEHAGWRYGHLDGWQVESKAEVLEALGPALGLTGYYGRNLDALEECVRDLPGPTVLLWEGWAALARADARTFRVVTEILAEAGAEAGAEPEAEAGSEVRAGTWVLLRGDGPDLEVPELD